MACSGVWIEHLENGGIAVGVTDYHVSEFGDSDWEWSAHFDKKNAELLNEALKKEFNSELSFKEMISIKFGRDLDTLGFTKYCNDLKLSFEIKRGW